MEETREWPRCPRCGLPAEITYDGGRWMACCLRCGTCEYGESYEQAARCLEAEYAGE